MSPERYRECLHELGFTQRGLGRLLGCSDRLTRLWAMGGVPVPDSLAVWLETCLTLRGTRHGLKKTPPPPKDWRRRPVIWIKYRGKEIPLARACEAADISRPSVYYRAERDDLSFQQAFTALVREKARQDKLESA